MNLAALTTEARNSRTEHIDQLPTLDMLRLINDEDAKVAAAVTIVLPDIAKAIDAIAQRFNNGGRLFYIGAGTSGRLGVLDASECPPTFSVPADFFHAIIAGGDTALRKSSEQSEDSPEQGAADLAAAGFAQNGNEQDTLIGIAASGRTPYVLGALAYARKFDALTIALTCVPDSQMAGAADISIAPITGPEILTGSTRMKAGTATKLVLNMISTGVMIKTGAVYGNLMVNMQTTNAKLVDRAERIIAAATGVDQAAAARLLSEGGTIKTAIVMQKLSIDRHAAEAKLAAYKGNLSALLNQNL
ncbi:N-acetylmuramic acid 6-phosphate etherase [Tunturiibacter lichenicola]|uniref:N-acetylmuramic acid 6-phosphate etherase n=1 Tax=Tunturiibacter lichenicola TaxID=2051959 RepID=UPI003D9B551D